jgi:hypothetical protein
VTKKLLTCVFLAVAAGSPSAWALTDDPSICLERIPAGTPLTSGLTVAADLMEDRCGRHLLVKDRASGELIEVPFEDISGQVERQRPQQPKWWLK